MSELNSASMSSLAPGVAAPVGNGARYSPRPPHFLLSVVVPCFNEEESLEETHRRLSASLALIPGADYEIIYVDDGSRDRTFAIMAGLQESDAHVRVIRLSRNFGHQLAVTAGIQYASGDAVVLIDADLQDPPELIATFVQEWRNGNDVVYGVRTDRPGESAFKLFTAHLFYRMIQRMSDTPIPLDVGDFRLMDRRVAAALSAMPERHRFIRGMVSWIGFQQVGVPYRRDPRFAGESKYPLIKMLRFAFDGVSSFSIVPLRLASWLGFGSSLVALAGIAYAIGVRIFTNEWVPGWAALFTAVLFVGGVQLICLGLVGEYVGRIYAESKGRPLFLVRELGGFTNSPAASPAASHVPTMHGQYR